MATVTNFSRYIFHKNGSVTNATSGKAIQLNAKSTMDKQFYSLINDDGKKVSVPINTVKAEGKKDKEVATPKKAAPAKKAAAEKKSAEPKKKADKKEAAPKKEEEAKSHKPSLNYDIAQEIRKKISEGGKQSEIASEYNISTGAVYFIKIYEHYKLKKGDKAWLPVPAGMERKEK